jgi:hypothetical protein
MASRYVVGIDLGTTHTVMAFADTERAGAHVEVFAVPQLLGPGQVGPLPLLPSALYLPGEHELPAQATQLPWGAPPWVVGQFARAQGARVPGRLVASAKSWLTHAAVDRTQPILPWGAPGEVARVSPVQASARYLEHLRHAWDARFPGHPLADQELVLTVPASFDEVARELTARAAQEAGLPRFVLLEEPQAAFYDHLSRHTQNLEASLGGARLLLVVDVGGGTTDLTLIHARFEGGRPVLTRLAVGEHLMLGGDNMDMLLARACEERFPGTRLDATQWSMLVAAARTAKEQLLADGGPEHAAVAVVGRGSRLVGGTLKTDLTASEVRERIIEGFFPFVAADAPVQRGPRGAIQELGLPFASDPAIPRHIAAFLRRHAQVAAEALGQEPTALPRPDAVLLNGGVFNARVLQRRLLEVMERWYPPGVSLRLLPHDDLDLAVARGASWFGRVRRGEGVRIGGGSARAYFVGVAGPAGEKAALCVVPRRQEEGTEVQLDRAFALLLDRPVRFELYSSTRDQASQAGALQPLTEDIEPLPPLETVLTAPSGLQGEVPVQLVSRLSEVGTLELSLVSVKAHGGAPLRWKLEFQLRGSSAREGVSRVEPLPARFAEGRERVELVYGKRPQPVSARDVKDLFRNLERILGPREGWSTAICRELWGALHAGAGRRRRSADHERVWFQLAGFTLRPGFGHPLDAWRAAQTFSVFEPGLQFHTDATVWTEWWILWRRIAGGLDAAAHRALHAALLPTLRPPIPGAKPTKPKGVAPQGHEEMVRLAASLEHLSAREKAELGEIFLKRLDAAITPAKDEKPLAGPSTLCWALGRVGARRPFFGSAHTVVAPEVAAAWLDRVLALDPARVETVPFAAMQLSRRTDDRARDLDPERREQVARLLVAARAPSLWVQAVREGLELEQAEEARVFGESLPAGLKLLGPM